MTIAGAARPRPRPHDLLMVVFPAFTAARYTLAGKSHVLLIHNDTHLLKAPKMTWAEQLAQRAAYKRRVRKA